MSGKLVILFAEDNFGNFTLTERYIRRWGVTVPIIHFADGQAVIDFLFSPQNADKHKSCKYLLLLDLNMPKVSGVDILREIRESPEFSEMPVFVVSTSNNPKNIEQCRELGCDEYFVKPLVKEPFIGACKSHGLSESMPGGLSV